MATRISFLTNDGVEIVGTFERPPKATSAALCLHMMPADRTSWLGLQEGLAARNVASLAIDLRGHGESISKGGARIDYRRFTEQEHQASQEDVSGALAWLEAQGFSKDRVAVVGGSIGANLALRAAASHSLLTVCLLSPGENYRGVTTYDAARNLKNPQALLVVASEDDAESYDDSERIMELAQIADKRFISFPHAGHATGMFISQPELLKELADWIAERLA